MAYGNELYQQVILDHNRNPRNYRALEGATHRCEGRNPLCGDSITVFLRVDAQGSIEDIAFQGNGCAISKASASLMTAHLKGRKIEEAQAAFHEFHDMVRGEYEPEGKDHHLGKLTLFKGVREYPARVKCASLAWHAMSNALEAKTQATSDSQSGGSD